MNRRGEVAVALTIAGSDSSGGAGVQADLKTFHRHRVYGASVLTLVTVQNTVGVREVHLLAPELVAAQIAAVAEDLPVGAVKTGALGSEALVTAVAEALERHRLANLVVDPVMVSKHGDPLIDPAAVAALAARLFPLARLVTPNRHEAAAFLGAPVEDEESMAAAARAIAARGARAVLVKGGGGLAGEEAVDLLLDGGDAVRLAAPRVATVHTHGSGCTYAAAITAGLARGASLADAVRAAKAFMSRAIATAPGLGRGRGPVNHWA